MAQIFHRGTNSVARMSILGLVFALLTVGLVLAELQRSSWVTRQYENRDQKPPFSHQHHVGGEGFDCRYCHTSVESSSFAGIPPTKTCMNCHAQIWTNAPMLEPVRESYRTGASLEWVRVHDLPDFVYFDHSIHIAKGVGCRTCHGQVDNMPLMHMENSLQMEWCLDCHRQPEKYIRPKSILVDGRDESEQIFSMKYEPPRYDHPITIRLSSGKIATFYDQKAMGKVLRDEYHLRTVRDITSCSTCHR